MRRHLIQSLRAQVRAGRVLFLLSWFGVALGVAAVLSIQILNQNALGAFAGSVQAVSGEAQLSVLGRTPDLPESLFPLVLAEPGVRSAAPLVRVDAALSARPGASLEIAGTDLFAPLRTPWAAPRGQLADPLAIPGWVAVSPALAAEMGWRIGDRFEVTSGSRRASLTVGALVDFQRRNPLVSRRLALMDIAQAQGLLGRPGQLQEIDVQVADGIDLGDLRRRLEARLGPGARVVEPEQRRREAEGLLSAFRLNLTALSLVSLLVGGFLVYASTQASLQRRREEFGILRVLGATRAQVLRLILAEAALLGVLGTAAGIPLGVLAARANVGTVSATVQNLYLLEAIERVEVSPWLLALAVAIGLCGALAGALLPAIDTSRKDPRALLAGHTLHEPADRAAGGLATAGWLFLGLVTAGALTLGRGRPLSGFAVAIGILTAIPLSAPWAVGRAGWIGRHSRFSLAYGVRSLASRLWTTAVPVAALALAVSMLAAITIMVGSFRSTVEIWLDQTLQADVYLTTPSWRRGRSDATLAPEVLAALAAEPGVRAVDSQRQLSGYSGDRPIAITGFDAGLPEAERRVKLMSGDPRQAMQRLRAGAVLVSEPLARKAGLAPGGSISIRTAAGEPLFPIAGITYDYGNESGAVFMDLANLGSHFGPDAPNSAALYLASGIDSEEMVARLKSKLARWPTVVRSNRQVRGQILSIFDQTFAVTRLLEVMGLLIAVSGVTSALLVLARDRIAELALYRALGATRGQIFRNFVGRGLGMAGFGLLLGAAGGVGLALVLVYLVNRDTFGWTIELHWPVRALAEEAAAILIAALAASLYPALRASRPPAEELSRDAL